MENMQYNLNDFNRELNLKDQNTTSAIQAYTEQIDQKDLEIKLLNEKLVAFDELTKENKAKVEKQNELIQSLRENTNKLSTLQIETTNKKDDQIKDLMRKMERLVN